MQRLTSSAARCCCSVLSYQSAPTAATLKRSISFFPSSSAPIQQDDIDPLPARIKPTSTQWYTGQPTYTDALNTLQSTQHALRQQLHSATLLPSYSASPLDALSSLSLPATEPPSSHWLSQLDLSDRLGAKLSLAQYRRLLLALNGLRVLLPLTRVADDLGLPYSNGDLTANLENVMAPYRRPRSSTELVKGDGLGGGGKKDKLALDEQGRAYAIGRRKEASAQLWLLPVLPPSTITDSSSATIGQFIINGTTPAAYFGSIAPSHLSDLFLPLTVTSTVGKYNVYALARSGGLSAQVDAVQLALARALVKLEGDDCRRLLKKGSLRLSVSFPLYWKLTWSNRGFANSRP